MKDNNQGIVVRYAIDLTIYTTHTRVGGGVASGWVLVDVNRLGYDGWWPVLVDADAESDLI